MDREAEQRLRRLAVKWISQARHPMRVNRPEERDLLIRCATELQEEIRDERRRVNGFRGPRRSCCPTQPGEVHLGTCSKYAAGTGERSE